MKKKIRWHGCQRSVSRITQYSNEEHHCCIYEELSAQMICVHQIRCHKKKRSDGLGHAAYMHACHSSHLHSHACHVTFPYNMHALSTNNITSHSTPSDHIEVSRHSDTRPYQSESTHAQEWLQAVWVDHLVRTRVCFYSSIRVFQRQVQQPVCRTTTCMGSPRQI
jgi:phage/plasmid-associated DNA primase